MTADTHFATRNQVPPPADVGIGLLIFIVLGGPIAWFLQLTANYGLVSHPCYPQSAPRTAFLPGWAWVSPALLAINLAALAAAFVAGFLALRLWRATRESYPPVYNELLPPAAGRTRFLAICGMLTGFGAVAAILFDLIALLTVPPCLG
jgi:hypothetical protein